MKKTLLVMATLLLLLSCICSLTACKQTPTEELWENAIYTENATVGEGNTTVSIEIIAGDKAITLTLKTNETNLAEALLAQSLITGEEGPYGLYIVGVNGIVADYDIDQTYWKLSKNGTELMTGASGVTIETGAKYEFTRTK